MKKHFVIIGNSAAAIGCVEGIRQTDRETPITLISDEDFHTYSRPLISYWLKGDVDDSRMYYRGPEYYTENKCELITGKRAVSIDHAAKKVALSDGTVVPYNKLLVATGSSPFVPPIEGLDSASNVFTFLSWNSARQISATLRPDSRVVILGAGLIGLKAAEGLHGKTGDITVVDLADRVLPSILDNQGAAIVQKHIESKGIKFILNDAAAKVENGALVLKSGTVLPFDILIVAVGVRPNTELVKAAGGAVNRGIATDCHQATSLPDIYAAGDCVECLDISSGQTKIMALLPNAYFQGEVAGKNMAAGCNAESFDKAIPMNAIGFFGLHMITAGSTDGEAEVTADEHNYKKLAFDANRLRGYIMIGDVDRAGIYTSLIREKTPLSELDTELLRNSPQLLIFNKPVRQQKLSGAKKDEN